MHILVSNSYHIFSYVFRKDLTFLHIYIETEKQR